MNIPGILCVGLLAALAAGCADPSVTTRHAVAPRLPVKA